MLFKKEETSSAFQSIDRKNKELQMIEIKAQLDGLKQYIAEKEAKYKTVEKEIEGFCRKFLDQEFAISQIGGSEDNILQMNTLQLVDFTEKKLEQMLRESDKRITLTVNELIRKNQEIEHLQRQIFLLKQNSGTGAGIAIQETEEEESEEKDKNTKKTSVSISEVPVTEDDTKIKKALKSELLNSVRNSFESVIKKPVDETPAKEEMPVKVIEINDKDIRDKIDLKPPVDLSNKNKKVIGHLVDLNRIMKSMPEIHWQILEAIGTKGLSEKDEITDYLSDKNPNIKETSLSLKVGTALGEMRVSDAVKLHKINTGTRTFYAYSLTDTGKRIYVESGRFSQEPVLSEVEILEKDHTTAYHGYGIKDSADILGTLGYTEITTGRKENTVELPNGDIYIPDIKAKSPFTGEYEYFEYELGHHKQSDFDRKCTKMRLASKTIHFIVPDITKRARVKNQIDDWRFNAGERAKGVEIKITTTRNLKKGMWDTDF